MRIDRIGFTPLKGGRHLRHAHVDLSPDGPVGDRAFCLLDPARARVLRTVENPALLRTAARWDAGVLTTDLPTGTVEGEPVATGEVAKVDYWGRQAEVETVAGPWAEVYSAYLGYEVVLARPVHAGEVVYGAPVTIVTTSSVRLLSERVGRELDSARFRATLLVDSGDAAAHVEDTWVGRRLRIGQTTLSVRGVVPRCAVVDLEPVTGVTDAPVLATLAGYRRGDGEITFGVDAVVSAPGRVLTGDTVELERG